MAFDVRLASRVRDLTARIGPLAYDEALTRKGCREMDFTGKAMRGYVFVGPAGTRLTRDLDRWVRLALDFNKRVSVSAPAYSPGEARPSFSAHPFVLAPRFTAIPVVAGQNAARLQNPVALSDDAAADIRSKNAPAAGRPAPYST